MHSEHCASTGTCALIAEDRPENLAAFAELLAAHIRFEETELLETAQRLLGPDVL